MGFVAATFAGDVIEQIAREKARLVDGTSLEEVTKDGLPNPVEGLGNGVAGILDAFGQSIDGVTNALGDGIKNTVGRLPIIGGALGLAGDAVHGVGDIGAGLAQDAATMTDSLTGIATGIGSGVFGMQTAQSAHEARLENSDVPDDFMQAVAERGLLDGGVGWIAGNIAQTFMPQQTEAVYESNMVQEPLMTQLDADQYLADTQRQLNEHWGQAFQQAMPETVEENPYAGLYADATEGGKDVDTDYGLV